MHLICGECGALLLDTGYGIGNLKSVIEQLTDKPVSVFNTHWHGDHTGGNSQFENVYMHEFDIPYWKESLSCEAGRMLPVTLAFSQDAVIPLSDKFIRAVHDGMTFHLGGRIETIVHMPGHSAGNCMVIDSKTGILFSGDAILSTPTLVIDGFPAVDHAELLTVEAFHTALVQHMKQLNKVKWLCPSHGRLMLSNKYVSAMQHCTEEILKAPDKWERYDYIPSLPGMIRCVDDAMIVYSHRERRAEPEYPKGKPPYPGNQGADWKAQRMDWRTVQGAGNRPGAAPAIPRPCKSADEVFKRSERKEPEVFAELAKAARRR